MNNAKYKLLTLNSKRFIEFEIWETHRVRLLMTTVDSFRHHDPDADKRDDLELLKHHLRITEDLIFSVNQIHSADIVDLSTPPQKTENPVFPNTFDRADGLLSSRPACLVTKFADCTPVVLFDKRQRVLASLHSGWKGTLQRISEKAIDLMKRDHASSPDDLLVFIGPAIAGNDFEVGQDLVDAFIAEDHPIGLYLEKKANGKFLFDMRSLLIENLIRNGIRKEHITITDLSTFNDPLLHSYRRDKESSGRMLLLAYMK